jgi:hypothetical protein
MFFNSLPDESVQGNSNDKKQNDKNDKDYFKLDFSKKQW